MALPVVRVSIFRVAPDKFDMFVRLMEEAETALGPGIRAMPGFQDFVSGADRETLSLVNVSYWDTVEHAKQLDHFQPMLELGRRYAELGAQFERPIMNYAPLWRLEAPASGQ